LSDEHLTEIQTYFSELGDDSMDDGSAILFNMELLNVNNTAVMSENQEQNQDGDNRKEEFEELPTDGDSGIFILTEDGKWVPGDEGDIVERKPKPETEKSQLEKLKNSIVNFDIVIDIPRLNRYMKYNRWALLQDDDCEDSPLMLINHRESPADIMLRLQKDSIHKINADYESPADFKALIAGVLQEICSLIINDLSNLQSKYEKLTYLNNELQWATKALSSFGYPISMDFFGNYLMEKPENTPSRYQMTWCKGDLYNEEAIFNIEKVYIPKVVGYRFSAIADYIIFLKKQIEIVQSLNIPPISPASQTQVTLEPVSEAPFVDTPSIDFPGSISQKSVQNSILRLDIRQTALLFHYLKEYGLVLTHSPNAMSKMVSALTGYSKKNLQDNWNIDNLNEIKGDQPSGKPDKYQKIQNFNLNAVRTALQEIIDEIDHQMKINTENNT